MKKTIAAKILKNSAIDNISVMTPSFVDKARRGLLTELKFIKIPHDTKDPELSKQKEKDRLKRYNSKPEIKAKRTEMRLSRAISNSNFKSDPFEFKIDYSKDFESGQDPNLEFSDDYSEIDDITGKLDESPYST